MLIEAASLTLTCVAVKEEDSRKPLRDECDNKMRKWLEKDGEEFLRKVGIRGGQIVLDFGCGSGNYAIPAARIVGRDGRVYALDKKRRGIWPGEGLDKLTQRARSRGLQNIVRMKTSGELKIALEGESVDVVLLYDVLHSYYFPKANDRRRLLREVYRILKPDGFISFYPGDPEVSRNYRELEVIKKEIEEANFCLESEYTGIIIHEDMLVEGHVLNFSKKSSKQQRTEDDMLL
jgi:ubiquinone/menaquinone biosynthesis C-methylase UbiE